MPLYRKKPVEIEAMLFDHSPESASSIIEWAAEHGASLECHHDGKESHILHIPTLEGLMHGSPGDMIIKGVKGEFYPCKPDIFAATYESV